MLVVHHNKIIMKSISLIITACLAVKIVADEVAECEGWAQSGECSLNPTYMHENCPDACADQAERDKKLAEQIGKISTNSSCMCVHVVAHIIMTVNDNVFEIFGGKLCTTN